MYFSEIAVNATIGVLGFWGFGVGGSEDMADVYQGNGNTGL